MPLDESIVTILEKADRPLKVSEITRLLSINGHGFREGKVERCLRSALWSRVCESGNKRWRLKSAEPSSSGTGPESENEHSQNDTDSQSSSASGAQANRELSRRILEIFEKEDQPLKARHLEELLHKHGYHADKTSINRCLYGTLNERVRRDSLARWSLRDDEEEAFDPPENKVQRRTVRLFGETHEALSAQQISEHLSETGEKVSEMKVQADLFRLKRAGHVRQDQQEEWYLTDVSLIDQLPGEPESASAADETASDEAKSAETDRETPPASADVKAQETTDEDKAEQKRTENAEEAETLANAQRAASSVSEEHVVQVLRAANQALKASEIADQLDAPVTKKKVVQLLNPLYESGRVLLDQQYRWQLALDERSPTDPSSEAAADSAGEVEPTLAPAGDAHAVTTLLERAKQVAVLLDLAPQPLPTDEITRLLCAMGYEAKDDDVEVLLRGPLRDHARHTSEGWQLCPDEADEAAAPPDDTAPEGPEPDELLAQTIGDDMSYSFVQDEKDTPAFFSTSMTGGSSLRIELNKDHPAHQHLKAALLGGSSEGEARTCLRLLLAGWAQYEADLNDMRSHQAQRVRTDWGSVVRRLLRQSH